MIIKNHGGYRVDNVFTDLVGSKPPSPPSSEPETMAPETERPTQKPTTPTTAPKPTQTSHGGPTGKKTIRRSDG